MSLMPSLLNRDRRSGPVAPVEEGLPSFDVYAALGVTEEVTPALAREMYWLRLARLQADEVAPAVDEVAPRHAREIEELNEALALVLDDARRARYDASYLPAAPREDRPTDQPRRRRAGSILALVLITVVAAIVAALQSGPLMVACVVTAGMLTMLAVTAIPRRPGPPSERAFAVLHLAPDAGVREVNVAYEVIGQELLSRLKHDRRAIARLERLDRAHATALRLIASREAVTPDAGGARAASLLAGLVRAVARFVLDTLGRIALALLVWLMRAASRAVVALGGRAQDRAGRFAALIRPGDEPDPDLEEVTIDVGRRLAIGRPQPVEGVVGAGAGQAGEAPPQRMALVRADIVLETENGNRRVPIPATPLTIGSGPECDLVLPATLGLAPEHAHVWQRDGALIIHVVTQRPGACLVNDEPMTWASLEDGDVILLGDARFSIRVAA